MLDEKVKVYDIYKNDLALRIIDLERKKLEVIKELMLDVYKNPDKHAGALNDS